MADSMNPLVTVVMCVYNAGAYLRPALLSVLSQTYSNLEVLIVDDGSTDGCMQDISSIDDPRIRILRQENRGKPAALNLALDHLRGEFYAVSDADDISYPLRIERQLQCLLEHPQVAGVYSGYELILDGRRTAPVAGEKDEDACRGDIAAFCMPSHDPTGMYRMSAVGRLRYCCDLPVVEGYDYILRLGEQYPLRVVGECLYAYRVHSKSITKRDPAKRERLVTEAIRRACARRGITFEQRFPERVCPSDFRRHRDLDNNLAAHFMDSVCSQKQIGRLGGALGAGLRCLALHPDDPHYWKALVYAVLPIPIVQRIRARRMAAAR